VTIADRTPERGSVAGETRSASLLACVVNVSEGRDAAFLAAADDCTASSRLDRHSDPDHHRSVFTLAGPSLEADVARLARLCLTRLDLRRHEGAHPRLGVLDVVPFVSLRGNPTEARRARDRTARLLAHDLGVPVFLYGPERSLPEIRRSAFRTLEPDLGPSRADPRVGATACGVRGPLVAYNLWLDPRTPLARARQVAAALRGPEVRALAFRLGDRLQLSFNLLDPQVVGPAEIMDRAASLVSVVGAELVGLLPAAVLARIPPDRWGPLDLDVTRTVEWRLAGHGLLEPVPPAQAD